MSTPTRVSVGEETFLALWASNDHIAEDSVEKDVGLSVDGRESHLVFIDHGHGTMKLENLLLTYSPQAVLVVMAVDNMESCQLAEHILVYLTHNGYIEDKVIRVHSKRQSASQFALHCTALEQKFRNDVNRCTIAPEQNHCSGANFWNDVLSVRCSLGCNSLLQSKIT